MEIAELKEQYKELPPKKRLPAAAGVGVLLLVAAYFMYFDFTLLEEQLITEETSANEVQARFEAARDQKANLPKLEEAVAFTEEQLAKAKAKLPSSYDIEDTLHKVSMIAREINVQLPSFQPGQEIRSGGSARYAEMPIAISVCGSYVQVAAFFDRVVHLEQSIKVRNIKMVPAGACSTGPAEPKTDTLLTGVEAAKEQRRRIRVETTADLVLFRAGSDLPPAGSGGAGAAPVPSERAVPPSAEAPPIESVKLDVAPPRIGKIPVGPATPASEDNG